VQTLLAVSAVREADRSALMALFSLVHDIDGERRVMIREAGAQIFGSVSVCEDLSGKLRKGGTV
jgi:hypothetical protein